MRSPAAPQKHRSARGARATKPKPLGSVVIPAHNEAHGIGRGLDALLRGFDQGEFDVVAVCNGCTDETAADARTAAHYVRMIELDTPSKPAALRPGMKRKRASETLRMN